MIWNWHVEINHIQFMEVKKFSEADRKSVGAKEITLPTLWIFWKFLMKKKQQSAEPGIRSNIAKSNSGGSIWKIPNGVLKTTFGTTCTVESSNAKSILYSFPTSLQLPQYW